jgi:hypothetical protein
MISDKELIEQIHIIIHSIRLIPKYNSSEAEKKIGRLIRERFESECKECRDISERIKSTPSKESFFTKLGRAIE